MTQRLDSARSQEILDRWCALAEARLEYLAEMFETGRWRRYYSESAFLENIREATAAVETWRGLATREVAPDKPPVDTSWLDRPVTVPPRLISMVRKPARPRPLLVELGAQQTMATEAPVAAPVVPIRAQMNEAMPAHAPAASPHQDDDSWEQQAPDIAAMQERYPLLRNAM